MEFLAEIKDELINYLKNGTMHLRPMLRDIAILKRISNLDLLINIHFMFQPKIINYINSLTNRIRSIDKTTQVVEHIATGKIRGKINWPKTLSYSAKKTAGKRINYIEKLKAKSFSSEENRVLKKFLNELIIALDVVEKSFNDKAKQHKWMKKWFGPTQLASKFRDLIKTNVYLRLIPGEDIIVNNRVLENVRRSRYALYREAAKYLKELNVLKKRTPDFIAIRDLFKGNYLLNTKAENLLFEIYWCYQILRPFNASLHQIRENTSLVGEADFSYNNQSFKLKLYHGLAREFKIYDRGSPQELENLTQRLRLVGTQSDNFIKRCFDANRTWETATQEIFNSQFSPKTNRPDITIIIEPVNGGPKIVIFCEVKYSVNQNYINSGLRQLVDYLVHSCEKDTHIYLNYSQNYCLYGILYSCDIDIDNFTGILGPDFPIIHFYQYGRINQVNFVTSILFPKEIL